MGTLGPCVALVIAIAAAAPNVDGGPATPVADVVPEVVRYEGDRLTVNVTNVPLDRVLAQIAAVTRVTIRGAAAPRPVTIQFDAVPLREGLGRIFGEESFMLTYGRDGTLRTIDLLARAVAASPVPSILPPPTPRPPLAEEEAHAAILRREITVSGPLAGALATERPAIGQVLHAVTRERRASVRAAAREAALDAFVRDPAIESAYLSTLAPVDDAVLAQMLRASAAAPGSAEEWLAALSARAPSAALRAKATAVLAVMR